MVPILDEVSPERIVIEVEKDVAEQFTMPLCKMSSGIVEFDRGEKPSANELKCIGFSLADLLSDGIVPLVKYLDRKMAKNLVLASVVGS